MELVFVGAAGLVRRTIWRRRWRLVGTTQTRLDRCPDEVPGVRLSLLALLVKVWSYLSSGRGLQVYDEPAEPLERFGARRTVGRWLGRLKPHALRLQQALRTAVIERLEPQPVEELFPRGLSPPGAVRCRRWKEPDSVYSLHIGLAFLFAGAVASSTSATVLLAEARRRLDGHLAIAAS